MANWVKNAILGLFPSWARDAMWSSGSFMIDVGQNIVKGAGETVGNIGKSLKLTDFVWRPGSLPATISPTDTLVGYKGTSPFGGGETHITNNFYGFTRDELRRELDDRDARIVDEIRRLVKQ
jgi:hypothetical protein